MIYGLAVESELRLTSVDEVAEREGVPALRVVFGSPEYFQTIRPVSAPDPDDWVQHAVLADGSVYMKADVVFEAVISPDGRDVVCRKLGDVDQRSFEANLMNFVVSASLTLQGEEPLHATVVDIEGRAVGLLGLSGAGKSTLAAFLISHGADLVTDDMLRVKFTDDALLVYPGPYRLKLLDEAGNRFLPAAVAHGHFNPLSGKIMVQPRKEVRAGRGPMRLAALFHIGHPDEQEPIEGVSSARLVGLDLATTLISSTMDTRYAEPSRLARQIRFAARVAGTLPIYELRYPRNFDVMDKVAAEIRRVIQ
ncbi:MAG: hypothetical protein Q8L22_10910 [Reyranella sp.]|nr:hypothetical protein [Reyranella sp.]